MCRSGWPRIGSIVHRQSRLVSPPVRILVLAVGRLRPPFADDVQHYQRMIARHVRLELIEVREEERVEKRIPERAFKCRCSTPAATQYDSVGFSRFLEQRRMSGRDLCFVVGGPYGLRSRAAPTTACRSGR